MPSVTAFQTNFSAGELSPRLYGRVDIEKYTNGAYRVENFIIQRYGGAKKRGGTEYIAEAKTNSGGTRLVSFIYSVTQAYVLEFGNLYIRIYTNGGRVESPPGTPVEVVTPYGPGDVFDLQFAQSADVLYITHPDYAPRTLTRNSATSFTLATLEFKDGPYLELNTTSTTLTPADTGELASAEFTIVGDATGVENIGGSGVSDAYWIKAGIPAQAPTEWTIEGFDGSVWVPLDSQGSQTGWAYGSKRFFSFANKTSYSNYRIVWFGNNGDADSNFTITINESGDTMTPFNLTASAATGINGGSGFLTTDVDRMIRLLGGDGLWRWARIVTRTSSTVVTVRMYGQALPDTRPIINWQMGAWSTETGWPACVGFYTGRLCFARTETQPQTVWMSVVDDFTNMGVSDPLQDDDAIDATIASDSINVINWIAEGTDLFVGTTAAIRTIGPTTASTAFSPTNIRQKRETNYGAGSVQPVRVGTTALYSGYYLKDVREIAYSFDFNGYISNDLSILSEHIPASGVKQLAYAQNPDSVVWIVTEDNALSGMTYERDQEVIAFHEHVFGGALGGISPEVISIATIPGTGGDELWLAIRRTIAGNTELYIERMSVGLDDSGTKFDATYLDSYLTYSGASTTTITGLSHLNGESVYVWNGAKQGPYTVSAGSITIGTAVTDAIVGLAYESVLETLSPEAAARGGTAQTRLGRISEVFVRLDRSIGGTVGPADGTQETIDYSASTDTESDYGSLGNLYTGDVRVPISMAWERQKRLKLVHSDPSPFHVLGLITEIRVSG